MLVAVRAREVSCSHPSGSTKEHEFLEMVCVSSDEVTSLEISKIGWKAVFQQPGASSVPHEIPLCPKSLPVSPTTKGTF